MVHSIQLILALYGFLSAHYDLILFYEYLMRQTVNRPLNAWPLLGWNLDSYVAAPVYFLVVDDAAVLVLFLAPADVCCSLSVSLFRHHQESCFRKFPHNHSPSWFPLDI